MTTDIFQGVCILLALLLACTGVGWLLWRTHWRIPTPPRISRAACAVAWLICSAVVAAQNPAAPSFDQVVQQPRLIAFLAGAFVVPSLVILAVGLLPSLFWKDTANRRGAALVGFIAAAFFMYRMAQP
jgi:hypothetical protein